MEEDYAGDEAVAEVYQAPPVVEDHSKPLLLKLLAQ